MKTIIEFLRGNYDFFQFILFEGRYGGYYGLIVPHCHADSIRENLTDGGVDDYELVIKLEKLLLETPDYPGAKGTDITKIIEEATIKLNTMTSEDIFNYISKNISPII